MSKTRLETILHDFHARSLFTDAYVEWGILDDPKDQRLAEGGATAGICLIGRQIEQVGPDGLAFDLASLSKALITAPLVLKNIEAVSSWLDQNLADISAPITLDPKRLLSHRAGFVPWLSFYAMNSQDEAPSKEFQPLTYSQRREIVIKVLRRAQKSGSLHSSKTGLTASQSLYSDVGMIVAGVALENALGQGLSELKKDYCSSLGLNDEIFYSTEKKARTLHFASSGLSAFSGVILSGLVQDENARFLGMECGHSGLFSTGPGLSRYLRALLTSKEGLKLLSLSGQRNAPETLTEGPVGFRKADDPTSSLLFGPSKGIGHFGYTGTSFWIDPETSRYHILLCNRLHKGIRDASLMRQFRTEIYQCYSP